MAKRKAKQAKPVMVTLGREWREAREEGYVVILPSGHVARLRPVPLDVMIRSGRIPDTLTPLAAKMLWVPVEPDKAEDIVKTTLETVDLLNLVCQAAMLEPRVVDEPQADDEISLEDIGIEDKTAIFQLSLQPSRILEKFRDRQAAGLATVSDGQDDRPEAE